MASGTRRRRPLLIGAGVVVGAVLVVCGATVVRGWTLSGDDRLRDRLDCRDTVEFESDLYQWAPMTGYDCTLDDRRTVSVRQYETAAAVDYAWSVWEAPVGPDIRALVAGDLLVVGPTQVLEGLRPAYPGSALTASPYPPPRLGDRQRARNDCMQTATAELVDQVEHGSGRGSSGSAAPQELRDRIADLLAGADVARLRLLESRSATEFEGALSSYGSDLRDYCAG